MSLRVWLPLNGDLTNNGLSDVVVTNNGATVDNAGKIGKCYYFNTTASYLALSNNAMNKCTTECSLSFWLNITSWNTSYATYFQAGLGGAPYNHYIFGVLRNGTASNLCFTISNGSSASNASYITSNLVLNTWYYLTFVYKTGHCLIYIDGELYKDYATTIVPNFSGITKTTVGICNNGSSYQTNCKINDLRIYDHVLSPKEVKLLSQGLVCHYKLSDPYIESTTNIVTTTDCLSATCYNAARRKYGYGENTDMYKTTGVFNGKFCTKLYMGTSGESARPYPYINNMFVSNGTNQPKNKTISFDYYGTIGTYINPYKLGSGSATCDWRNNATTTKSGTFTDSGQIPVVPNRWNHISFTLTGTTDANAEWGYIILGDVHTSDTANYWLFANLQIEEKDHETPYAGVGGTRNENIVYDSSGYNRHGVNYSSQVLPNAPRNANATFFDGSSQYIEFPNLSFMPTMLPDEWSFSFWVYNQDQGDRSVLFSNYGLGGVGGLSFGFEKTTGEMFRVAYVNGKFDRVIPNSTLTLNEWTHFVVTKTKEHLVTVYRNGVQIDSYTNTNCASDGVIYRMARDTRGDATMYKGGISDFRIYTTVLSATDAQELYNTPVSVANTGAMLTQGEFVEVAT